MEVSSALPIAINSSTSFGKIVTSRIFTVNGRVTTYTINLPYYCGWASFRPNCASDLMSWAITSL